MANAIVIGSQWGDEGKGKLVDILAEKADLVVRFQGGNNAGHTVKYADKKFVLHLIPSGVLHPKTNCLLGNGMVIDPEAFIEELAYLKDLGVDPTGQLFISDTAHLILPYHKAMDQAREDRLRANKIGTTVRGIGPAYEDKVSRQGIRFIDIENSAAFKSKVDQVVEDKNLILKHVYNYEGPFLSANEIFENLLKSYETIAPFVVDGQEMLYDAVAQGKQVLFEGAQGTFLDIDHGTFPYVTSSNTTAGGACTGSGLPPNKVTDVIGVVKAYTTRVGSGPFPSELFDEDGAHLAKVGDEFGATTGRARRCGWFDLCMLKSAVAVNGLTKLAITKLDVLDAMAVIKLCVAYKDPSGKTYERLPHNSDVQATLTPVYEEIAGWESNTVGTTKWEDLPENAIKYLNRIAELLGVPLGMVSTGPKREETIILSNPFS